MWLRRKTCHIATVYESDSSQYWQIRDATVLYCTICCSGFTYRCCTLHTYNKGEFAHFIVTCNRFWHTLDMWNGNDHISLELTWINFFNQIEIELKTCNNCLLCTGWEMNHIWKSNEQIKAYSKLRSWISKNIAYYMNLKCLCAISLVEIF